MSRVSVFTLVDRSVKNMGAVDAKVKALAIELIKRSYQEGINVQITSGLRTHAHQNRLYNQGRTTPGNIVTNAKAGQSVHNYGLAIDFVIVSHDGNTAIWVVNAHWRRVAAIGKQLGFQWGGDWKSFPDNPHLDMAKGFTTAQLAAGRRPTIPNVPVRGYIGSGDSGAQVTKMKKDLAAAGYKSDGDPYFGSDTKNVVIAFQKANGLEDDGLYGAASQAKLATIIAQGNKPAPSPKPIIVAPDPVPKPEAKPAVKPKEEVEVTEKVVVAHGHADSGIANLLAEYLGCGMIFRKHAENEKVAKTAYVVGGGKGKIKADQFVDLTGKTRWDTAKNVTAQFK